MWHKGSPLPKTGKKHFEPTGTWLEEKQIENGLKTRKKLLELERVDRMSQLSLAEWLSHCQKAKVVRLSGKVWDTFGYYEQSQMYLLPEEALFLLEMNYLELTWNKVPLSIEQAYEVLINSKTSKCTLDEYRVYSHLAKNGFKVKRFQEKPLITENKVVSATKKIIMNEGFWTKCNTKLDLEKNGNSSIKPKNNIEQPDKESAEQKHSKPLKVSEEKIIGNIQIIKNNSSVPIVLKRPKPPAVNNELECVKQEVGEKRAGTSSSESTPVKRFRPEVIDISDDEIEEIPVPMTRMDILNTLPNVRPYEPLTITIPPAYIPSNIRPIKSIHEYDSQHLLELLSCPLNPHNSKVIAKPNHSPFYSHITNYQKNYSYPRNGSQFYSQRSQCHQAITYASSNGFSYHRNFRWQQNISRHTSHNPFTGAYYSNMNYVMSVMSNMLNSSRITQTTFCQNFEIYQQPSRFGSPYSIQWPYGQSSYQREVSWRRGCPRGRSRGCPSFSGDYGTREENYSSFTVPPNVSSWSDLKQKWAEDRTIIIEDEDTDCDVQVVEEKLTPIIGPRAKISNISEVFERLKIIKPAPEKSIRSRKLNCYLSYEVYPSSQIYRRSESGFPAFRIYVVNSIEEPVIDFVKLQKLKQDSREIPVLVACVTDNSISFMKLDVIHLPNLQ